MYSDWTLRGWYYKREGCWTGPVSADGVAQLLKKRELQPSERLMEIWESGGRVKYTYREAETTLKKTRRKVAR